MPNSIGPDPFCSTSIDGEKLLDGIQLVLDFAGFIPVLGAGPDVINTIISAGRGNWGDAAVNAIAIIPFWGDAAKGGKMLAKAGQEGLLHADEISAAVNAVAKNGDKAKDVLKAGDEALSTSKLPTTPDAEAREFVQGEYTDPLTNQIVKTAEDLAADHIFPKKLVKELPGFKELSQEQQAQVLNNLTNFQGLPKSFNSSKGGKIDWSTFKGQPLDPEYARALAEMQQTIRVVLQQQIDDFLKLK